MPASKECCERHLCLLCVTFALTFGHLLVAAELAELRRREQEAGIMPEPALDRFMEAMSQQASVHLPFTCPMERAKPPRMCHLVGGTPPDQQTSSYEVRFWISVASMCKLRFPGHVTRAVICLEAR